MSYHLSIEKATEIADRAVSHMHEHKIPATPDNFTIWFEYVAGANPPLSNILDKPIKSDQKIDEKISRDIYEKHVSVANKATNSDKQVETIAEQLLDALKQAGEDTGQYEARLQNFSGTLDNAADAGEI